MTEAEILELAIAHIKCDRFVEASEVLRNSLLPRSTENADNCERLARSPNSFLRDMMIGVLESQLRSERVLRPTTTASTAAGNRTSVEIPSADSKVRFRCPQCSKAVVVGASHVGKKGKCPGCGTLLTVPAPEAKSSRQTRAEKSSHGTGREKQLASFKHVSSRVNSVSFSPDRQVAAAYGDDGGAGELVLFDMTTRKLSTIDRRESLYTPFTRVAFSPDGELLAAANWDQIVKVWYTRDLSLLESIKVNLPFGGSPAEKRHWLAFARDGSTLVASSINEVVLFEIEHRLVKGIVGSDRIDFSLDKRAPIKCRAGMEFSGLAVSPDGKTVATTSRQLRTVPGGTTVLLVKDRVDLGFATFFETPIKSKTSDDNSPTSQRHWDCSTFRCVAFAPCGTYLTVGGHDTWLLNAKTNKVIGRLANKRVNVDQIVFSPNGQYIATLESDEYRKHSRVAIWEATLQRELLELPGGGYTSVDFSSDSQMLATGSGDGTVIIWSLAAIS